MPKRKLKASKADKSSVCSILNLWKQNIFYNAVRKLKVRLQKNLHALWAMSEYANLLVNVISLRVGNIICYKSLPKHKTVIEDLDNIIQDFKTVTLAL